MMLCFIVTSSFLAGLPVPPSVVYSQLVAILNDATPPPEYPVSYLTSLERDKWALARSQLVTDPGNANTLDKIDSALLVMCLDDNETTVQEQVSHSLLHNWGANR
jgi:carnitine O-acetyltransferase